MISLETLAGLAAAHPDDVGLAVPPLEVKGRVFDTDERAVVMSVVNLSSDSTYRTSVAPTVEDAISRGRVHVAQGADVVDVGAESTTTKADRVTSADQIARLVPVVEALAADGILVSSEAYDVDVVRATLEAGAAVVNLTGSAGDDPVFELAAEHGAAVVLCHVEGENPRDLDGADLSADPVPRMLDGFGRRIERARELGVPALVVDPGRGLPLRGPADRRGAARAPDPDPAPRLPAEDAGGAGLPVRPARLPSLPGRVPHRRGVLHGAGPDRWRRGDPHPRGPAGRAGPARPGRAADG